VESKYFILIISILSIILITTLIILVAMAFYIFKLKNKGQKNDPPNNLENQCHKHKDKSPDGQCAICNQYFCSNCLKEHENLSFCSEHYQIFITNKWEVAHTVKTTPEQPTPGIELFKEKNLLWKKHSIPSYTVTYYKINIENDTIESYVKLYGRVQDNQRFNTISKGSSPNARV